MKTKRFSRPAVIAAFGPGLLAAATAAKADLIGTQQRTQQIAYGPDAGVLASRTW